jgi:hypothetical protein
VTEAAAWRRCSACKTPIGLGATCWVCNVSTCNRPRTGLVFCSVSCWEVHLPSANHRQAWAVEKKAPMRAEFAPSPGGSADPKSGQRRLVRPPAPPVPAVTPKEVLIVASRLKDYIRERSGFNTSDGVLEPLSEIVRRICDDAVRNASREGRRTVLDRDIPKD